MGKVAREFFSLRCPRLLVVVCVGVIALRLWLGQWNWWDLGVVAGVLAFWPLQEWLVHVFLLHIKPMVIFGRTVEPIVARNHRNHHGNPWDPELGITPTHIVWMYLFGLPLVWLPIAPAPQALTGMCLYFALVLNYEWLHYLIHTSYAPKSRYYRRLWRNHRLHHFQNENFWYGVTMLSGDWLLRTQPTAKQTPRSETVLTLGVATSDGQDEPAAESSLEPVAEVAAAGSHE